MKLLTTFLIISVMLTSCDDNKKALKTNDEKTMEYSQEDYDFLAIGNPDKISAASKRALERGYHKNAEWFGEFRIHNLKGNVGYEKGVTRRDPSMVIQVDGLYYTYYSKSTGKTYGFGTGDPEKKVFPWDKTEIWYATSKDGWEWTEQGLAVTFGPKGSYDDRSVFTPEVLAHNGKYYLVYQSIQAPYLNRSFNTVGMSVADSPRGPWKRLEAPILEPAMDGEWLGEEDSRFKVKQQGSFDSQKVHDPTLFYYKGKFYLYYKGERMGERMTAGGREIRWGVAIADKPEGPYIKSEYNPITQSGHEICIWPYKGGMALVHSADGPEKRTIQYAPDGINFEVMSYIWDAPSAMGLVTTLDNDKHPTEALRWGLCHKTKFYPGESWLTGNDYLVRFSFSSNRDTKREFAKDKDK
ncbi:glycoside hydrolase family 117 protein [Flavivirga rizhaonensis]|uniref:Glycosyl hydrolase n=1 Tax=Flavivirga rizhaonensis TaxID=2559571 RepID=A0A4S1DWG4_9FLAO|nr:family 43 glycosylhydrolase [Flavivirga rizhaonensis]TGV01848.1 glycosyl hydrolase [Flavivirga rizhaonensis]